MNDQESDEDRAELAWLLARDADPNAAPPSADIASQHAELEHLLRALPADAQDESWHAAVMKQITAAPGRRPRWRRAIVAGGGVLVAAVVALIVFTRPPAAIARVESGGAMRGSSTAHALGDHLIADLPPGGHLDLRVFGPTGELVARCPDGPACMTSSTGTRIELIVREPGWYQVARVAITRPLPVDEPADVFISRAEPDHTARFEFR